MKKNIFFPVIISLILLTTSCGPKTYSEKTLNQREAKKTTGIIIKQGRGTFILKDCDNNENHFSTGQLTQYIPDSYRSQEEDKVEVVFQEVLQNSGENKLAVLQLKPIFIPEKNKAPDSPISGKIIQINRGSTRHAKSFLVKNPTGTYLIYLKNSGLLEVNGRTEDLERFKNRWKTLIGKKVIAEVTRRPVLNRGNGYILETKHAKVEL